MFSTPAFAQTANAVATGPASLLMNLLPMVAVLGVFYFLLIRPQQARQKAHMALINGLKRGDVVVTAGGLIGKVSKISDTDVSVELAPNVVVKVVRHTISEVRGLTSA
ncbi:MAG: preprotein translocase subunit YajC, partial [Pseudomonadota bacterium]